MSELTGKKAHKTDFNEPKIQKSLSDLLKIEKSSSQEISFDSNRETLHSENKNESKDLADAITNFTNRSHKLEMVSKTSKTLIYKLEYEPKQDQFYKQYKQNISSKTTPINPSKESKLCSVETLKELLTTFKQFLLSGVNWVLAHLLYLLVTFVVGGVLIQFLKTDFVFMLKIENYILYVVKLIPYTCYCVQEPLAILFLFSVRGVFNIMMTSIWLFWEVLRLLKLSIVQKEIREFIASDGAETLQDSDFNISFFKSFLLIACVYFLAKKLIQIVQFVLHKFKFKEQYFYRKRINFSGRVDPEMVHLIILKLIRSFNIANNKKSKVKDFHSHTLDKKKAIYYSTEEMFYFFQIKRGTYWVEILGAFPKIKGSKLIRTLTLFENKTRKLKESHNKSGIKQNQSNVIDFLKSSHKSRECSIDNNDSINISEFGDGEKSSSRSKRRHSLLRKRWGSVDNLGITLRSKPKRRKSYGSLSDLLNLNDFQELDFSENTNGSKSCQIQNRESESEDSKSTESLINKPKEARRFSFKNETVAKCNFDDFLISENQEASPTGFGDIQQARFFSQNKNRRSHLKEDQRKTVDSVNDLQGHEIPVFDLLNLENSKHRTLNKIFKEKIMEYNEYSHMDSGWKLESKKKFDTKIYKKKDDDYITRMAESVCDLDIDQLFNTVMDKENSPQWMDSLSTDSYTTDKPLLRPKTILAFYFLCIYE